MIAFGCAIASERHYRRYAVPGIERAREPDSPVFEIRGSDCLFRAYNELLDRAAENWRIEAIVLIHEDTEILQTGLVTRLRNAFSDPDVAVVGSLGGIGVKGIDWWVHDYTLGRAGIRVRQPEQLYGTPNVSTGDIAGRGGHGQVDMVDGFFLALSRWAIRSLRFDESLGPGFHGYDADLCFQARSHGKKVVVAPIECVHHRETNLPDPQVDDWMHAHAAFRRKWEPRWPDPSPPPPPRFRARRRKRDDERD